MTLAVPVGPPTVTINRDDRVVVCPLHGYTFDLCTGSEAGSHPMSVRSYPVSAVDGAIRITT